MGASAVSASTALADEASNDSMPWKVMKDSAGVRAYFESTQFPGLSGAQTKGQFVSFLEEVTADYKGYPLVDDRVATTILVVEGKLLIRLAKPNLENITDEVLSAGDWLHIPPGIPHSYKSSGAPARFVVLNSPGNPSQTQWFKELPEQVRNDPEAAAKYLRDHSGFDMRFVPELGYPGEPIRSR
jgi:uncharacterized RmlC-like cupin family protein